MRPRDSEPRHPGLIIGTSLTALVLLGLTACGNSSSGAAKRAESSGRVCSNHETRDVLPAEVTTHTEREAIDQYRLLATQHATAAAHSPNPNENPYPGAAADSENAKAADFAEVVREDAKSTSDIAFWRGEIGGKPVGELMLEKLPNGNWYVAQADWQMQPANCERIARARGQAQETTTSVASDSSSSSVVQTSTTTPESTTTTSLQASARHDASTTR